MRRTILLTLALSSCWSASLAPAAPPAATPTSAPAESTTALVAAPPASALLDDEENTIDVFDAASPAVVFVTQEQVVRDFYMRTMEVPTGSGTGFIWDDKGHVVTNYHVVATESGAPPKLTVTLIDGTTHPARVVGVEPRKDIAVLEIQAEKTSLAPIRLPATDHTLRVGQKAVAIGNPFALDHTLTVGVISALNREVQGIGGVTIRDMIQTDAAINPGNSGGPLLDSRGQLIGMNTMIYSPSGSSAGIGFAVPVSTIRRVVPQIIETGKARQVGMGVTILDDVIARRNGIKGVIIREVTPDSPASAAGLRGLRRTESGTSVGDVIVGIDDVTIDDYDDLYNALDRREPGETVHLAVLRDGKRVVLDIGLVELP